MKIKHETGEGSQRTEPGGRQSSSGVRARHAMGRTWLTPIGEWPFCRKAAQLLRARQLRHHHLAADCNCKRARGRGSRGPTPTGRGGTSAEARRPQLVRGELGLRAWSC